MSLIEYRNIAKSFGECHANRDVSFAVQPKTIHGIVGENGAGKSTAMKMLYGMIAPTSGELLLNGTSCDFRSPNDAVVAGIGMVHQHFMLAESQTVLDNIILGAEFFSETNHQLKQPWWKQFFPIPRDKARDALNEIMTSSGIRVPLDVHVETLPVGMQQRVEILKLLYRQANILILDEPTAVLTPQETTEFFAMLSRLRESGRTILLISHKLGEIKAVTDFVTVFRGGKTIDTLKTANTSESQLATLMVGREFQLEKTYERRAPLHNDVLLVKNFSNQTAAADHLWQLQNLSLHVKAGEVVGIAGVEGNGQDALIALVNSPSQFLHDYPMRSLEAISACGEPITKRCSAALMRQRGLSIVAPDRHKQAVLLQETLADNLFLGAQPYGVEANLFKGPFLSQQNAKARAAALVSQYNVKPENPHADMRSLSGGNQQKFVCARELSKQPKLFVAAHPTRGVDIGAIEFIHQKIMEARNAGVGVLLISSELDELFSLSDRIYVMFKGQISGHFTAPHFSKQKVGEAMGGRFVNQAVGHE